MKKFILSLLVLLLSAGAALAQAPVVDPGWTAFVIREGATEAPFILDNDDYVTDAIEIGTTESGQKAGLATDLINGARIDQIATLHIDRLDDTATSGSEYGPYFNIWVTDGLGHYAVLANEPSDAEWSMSPRDVPNWAFLSAKRCKVYETPDVGAAGHPGTSWVATYAQANGWDGVENLLFEHVGGLVIAPPPVAYIQDSGNNVGSGAPDELATDIAYGYTWVFGDTADNYLTGGDGFIVDNYYATAPLAVQNVTLGTSYATIQAAINDAVDGNVITIDAGTYLERPVCGKQLTFIGADEATVIVDAGTGAVGGSYGWSISADNVSISDLTLVGEPAVSTPSYGFKPSGVANFTLTNVTATEFYRTGVDLNGVVGGTVTNVSAINNNGHGFALTDCHDVTLTSITASGNAWQGVSVATWGSSYALGTSGIVFDGTNSFIDPFQLEMGDSANPGVAPAGDAIITYSSDIGDGADVTVQAADYTFAVHGEQDDGPDQVRIWLAPDLAAAALLPAVGGPVGHFTGNGIYLESLVADGQWYATPGCSIQAAIDAADPGDQIDVSAGTYVEALLIEKSLTLLGATAGVNKNGYTVPAGYLWDDTVETVIQHPGGTYTAIVDIHDADDVTFEGFIVGELNAVANTNTSLVRVYAHSRAITNVNVVNNVIGPNTNVTLQDGAQGRMGLYIVNHPYGTNGVENSTFAGNKIFDCKGNGDNIFLWSSYYAYGAAGPADMTGTVIENNEIYGSHRAGIETAGGYANLTIRNNVIYGQTGLPADDPDFLKYGHGIQLIRGSSDKVSDPLTAYGPVNLTIEGNEIYDNEKCGIYMGPKNESVDIVGNVIRDNGWNGVMLDLEGNYWNPQFESPPTSGAYACYDCAVDVTATNNRIYGNGHAGHALAHHGVQLVGTPTNGFEIEAGANWWGDASGPLDASDDTGTGGLYNPTGLGDEVTDLVLYAPWTGMANGSIVPVTTGPLNCTQTVTLTFSFEADDDTPDVFLYNAVVSATAGLDFGAVADLEPFGDINNNFFAMATGANQWTITGSTVGSPTYPISGAGTTELFTITFSATGDVIGDVVFDSLTLRDPSNATIPVNLEGATITFDCTAPAPVTDITAAPGHNKVDVGWNHDGPDVDHFMIYRGVWYDTTPGVSAYPEYDDEIGSAVPIRPVAGLPDPGQGWVRIDDDAVDFPAESFFDVFVELEPLDPPRGVYYYEVFAVDEAGNISAPAAANDRATNYWLGDVDQSPGDSTPDGEVDPFDMNVLGTYFGTAIATGDPGCETDVGPTDDWSRLGIPTTDSFINFEDLMVFAMNFGVVADAKSTAPVGKTVDLAWVDYEDGTMALRLTNGENLKGLRITADVPVHKVTAGALLDEQSELTFLKNVGQKLDTSVAVMGVNNTFSGTGDLLIVDASAAIAMDDLKITVRGADNSNLELRLDETSDTPTPRVFGLADNYPNPFNPQTKIAFSLPEAHHVQLSIYSVDGTKVATLVNESRGAGLHEIIWTGRDAGGRCVASGTYFYRIEAGPYSNVKKMTLMK